MGIIAENENGIVLGIDFGTTNTIVSVYSYDDNNVSTIEIDGSYIFPTAIQFEEDIEENGKLSRVFGIQAKEGAIIYPESTVLSVKRLLSFCDTVPIAVDDKEYAFTPTQIAGEIFGFIKEKVSEYLKEEMGITSDVTGCVITVPANSTDKQKKLTKEAAKLGGFSEDKIHLRLEPAAAAISYAVHENKNKKILVYDFGGGTFDACILNIEAKDDSEPSISVISTYGDNYLGGNDIDKLIMDMIYDEFIRETDGEFDLFDDNYDVISLKQKSVCIARMEMAANQAKERLSQTKATKISLTPFLQEPRIININFEITRDDFLTHKRKHKLNDSDAVFAIMKNLSLNDIIDSTLEIVDSCLEKGKLSYDDIDEILLVGGSSNIPAVSEAISARFAKEPYKGKISPSLSISQGAAIYGTMIHLPKSASIIVKETTIHPLGIEIAGRRFMEIVKRGIEIPEGGLQITADEPLTTNFDNLTSMVISVYEDTSLDEEPFKSVTSKGMKRLSGTTLRGIPKAKSGQEKVSISFYISEDNMLKVTAASLSDSGIVTELIVDELY